LQLVEGAVECNGEAWFLATAEEAGAWLEQNLRAGDVVLVKGSRGVRLERALAFLADG
jgi:UDP-N-acetylmuramoyl-tripeptide--D-alanyl-D-alanine ligase